MFFDVVFVFDLLYVQVCLIDVFVMLLQMCDVYICYYCDCVGLFVQCLVMYCDFDDDVCVQIGLVVCFYDIGKIGIFDDVLLVLCWYIDEECVIMCEYLVCGEYIFLVIGCSDVLLVVWLICVYYEVFDGSGYFDGLCGEFILLGVCIVIIVDVYDVMISVCLYCNVMEYEVVLWIIDEQVGGLVDLYVL